MKQGKEDFDIVKDDNDSKRNYIFQKDGLTKKIFVFVAIVLVVLIIAVALTYGNLG
ncbi:hypothetical protein ACFQ1Q_02860 [Winogradskyella litorisediminis]|uniref:Uncharacterized protein n=1 Tax=Winogradskyella litorisediminis TaxID=1156618 RepID=A0ABW3N4B8_9FLAO